ncbi:hypothetical protein ACGFYZ_39950 [Streptomyces sp. NPDC048330]|uniref:hypothetical protein n=1 Tax=Streptomyces sp. NPDC048330 TaxID=3365533 RepID=UPI00372277AA
MAYWEITVPTVTADSRSGVQVFTYPAERFPAKDLAQSQARLDVDSADAIRHRRGASAVPDAIRTVWHASRITSQF